MMPPRSSASRIAQTQTYARGERATSGMALTDASCTGCVRGAGIATGRYGSDPMEFHLRHSSAGIAKSLMGVLLDPSAVLPIMRYPDTILVLFSLWKLSFKNSTNSLMMPEKLNLNQSREKTLQSNIEIAMLEDFWNGLLIYYKLGIWDTSSSIPHTISIILTPEDSISKL